MTIYTFVIYMFFIFVLGKNTYAIDTHAVDAYARNDGPPNINKDFFLVSESVASSLPLSPTKSAIKGIDTYRFFRSSFNDKLYAFQRTNSEAKDKKMPIWTSSDNGVTWLNESSVPCTLDSGGGDCDVMSSMIVNDELIVIYGNNTHYAIAKSTDGTEWIKGDDMERKDMSNKKILYYSGNPSDLSENIENANRYITCFETDEEPVSVTKNDYTTVAACAISDDEGQNWTVNYLLRIMKTVTNFRKIDHLSFFQKDIYFIADTDENENVLFICKTMTPTAKSDTNVMHCHETHKEGKRVFTPVLDINSNKDSSTIVIKVSETFTIGFMSYHHSASEILLYIKKDQLRIAKRDIKTSVTVSDSKHKALEKANEIEKDKLVKLRIIYASEFVLSVMYEYNDGIYNITAELIQKKQGCEYIKEDTLKKVKGEPAVGGYTQTVPYDEITSVMDKICMLDNFEPMQNETHVSFFVKVAAEVDFENSEDCFKHSHVENDEIESRKHERSVIKIKNIIELNEDPENKMKEIEFVYPASLHNLLKYHTKLTCTAKDSNFKITYLFQADEKEVATVKFDTLVKDFTDEENRSSLKDYEWNKSVPETVTGSYVLKSTNYMQRFQVYEDLLNNAPNAINNFKAFEAQFREGMNQYISVSKDEETEDYAGIDFTNSSKHYEQIYDTNITEDKTFYIKVVVPKEESVVGLICPLGNSASLDDLQCFDLVTDAEKKTVTFEELFTTIPFSISPKIMVYNQKVMAVESLLHLNGDSYDELAKITDAIQFHCICKVNAHTVTVAFAIGTDSSKFPENFNNDNNNDNNIITPKPKPPVNGGTHSILSAAVVLLVLLNVFSCTSFLN